jgi:Rps23 Pro-64 3,4-dihydroxylase Tpa1-like proline 4-hydroxylase
MSSTIAHDFTKSLLPEEKLQALSDAEIQAYRTAEPYPHAVFDDFFDEEILDRILEEFPGSRQIDWQKFNNSQEIKLASKGERQLGHFTRYFIYHLNSSTFINFLQRLTGITGLIPDPHLTGGGLHQILPGGKLGVHIDFNVYKDMRVDRRLNVLVYLNRDWREDYGGHFELWNRDMTACVKKILPVFNRMVVFSTNEISYHGHPNPLTCPEDRSRRSLALYYYSNGRPEEGVQTKASAHSTVFVSRPGETIADDKKAVGAKDLLKKFVPPILVDAKNAIFKR